MATKDAEFKITLTRHAAIGSEIWHAVITSDTHEKRGVEGDQADYGTGPEDVVKYILVEIQKYLENRKTKE